MVLKQTTKVNNNSNNSELHLHPSHSEDLQPQEMVSQEELIVEQEDSRRKGVSFLAAVVRLATSGQTGESDDRSLVGQVQRHDDDDKLCRSLILRTGW